MIYVKERFRCEQVIEYITVLVILLTLILFGSLAGESPAATGPAVLSAAEADYPPFSIVDKEGRAGGFSVELMRAALESMGREVTFRPGLWADVKNWLEQGDVQALPLVGRTPERESVFDFTFPYVSLHGAIVIRTDTTDIRDLRDLKGRDVAVMKGDNAEEFLLREDRGIKIHTAATFEDALGELSRGLHDAVVIQRLVALRLIQKTGFTNLQIVNQPIDGFRQDFCFGVREGDRETLSLLNEGLALVMADGTYRRLHAKWFAALELPSRNRIVIGGDQNYPPYEYLDENGRPAGYNVELTRAIAREMGLDVEIRLDDWAAIRAGLSKGEIDAVHGMFYSPDRDLDFDFSPPHTVINHVAVVRRGTGSVPGTSSELEGKRLVVMNGDIMHDFAEKAGFAALVTTVGTQEEALRELAQGRYDCALVARIPALYWIKKHGWENLVVGRHSLLSAEYCYAVPNNRKASLAQLVEGLKVLEDTGEYRRINNKWLGVYEESSFGLATLLRYGAMVAIPLLLLLLAFFLWSWSLRKQVARQTAELRESEAKLRAVLDATPFPVAVVDSQDDKVFYWSQSALKLFGHTSPSVPEWYRIAYPDPDYRREVMSRWKSSLETARESGRSVNTGEYRVTCEDGSVRICEIYATFFPHNLIVTFNDITGRRHAEEALRESEGRYRAFFEKGPDGVVVLDPETARPIEFNDQACRQLGYSREEFEQLLLADIEVKETAEEFRGHIRKVMDEGYDDFETLQRTKQGEIRHVHVTAQVIETAGGNVYHCIWRDITERRRIEDELLRVQKLESVGLLAGGIAHDFNNILTTILGNVSMAETQVPQGDEVFDLLKEAEKASIRAQALTKQLLTFAKGGAPLKETSSIKDILKEASSFVLHGSKSNCEFSIAEDLWPAEVDAGQISQVINNILINANQAMPEGGTIQVAADNVLMEGGHDVPVNPGRYIRISIKDQGVGIAEDHFSNIFDPYFTTKQEGIGLGLATSYSIIKKHDGHITLESRLGVGTTFHLYLPASDKMVPEKEKVMPIRGRGRILVMDDDTPLLTMVGRMLKRLGYESESAKDGAEAIRMYKEAHESGNPYDAVILDLTVPGGMGGKDAVRELAEIDPDLKAIVSSGYSDDPILSNFQEYGFKGAIPKPFGSSSLGTVLHEVFKGET